MRQEEENRPLRIYQCEDTQDGILTAVYEAGISGYGHKYIRIAPIRGMRDRVLCPICGIYYGSNGSGACIALS